MGKAGRCYDGLMQHIGSALEVRERNLEIVDGDPATAGGFTQVPNFILRTNRIDAKAKLTYATLLSYAWHNDHCFPGQQKLADDMGLTLSTTNIAIKSLEAVKLLEIKRRGQGKTNIYRLFIRVPKGPGKGGDKKS